MDRSADYVVVGAGSAGAVVARRLADSGASVILLEAGGRNASAVVRTPGMIALMHSLGPLQRRLTWQRDSVEQTHAGGRRIAQTHGRGLGGSSAVNASMFVRGNRRNFDDWAADGAPGWAYADVLPAFRRLESFEDGASEHRGDSGPIRVTRVPDVAGATESFLEALSSVAGVTRNEDYNGAEQEGASVAQQNAAHGRRQSTAAGYLDDAPSSLEVITGCSVRRVVIRAGRAVGVEVRTQSGLEEVRAEREVVLSAGSFASPQLLMLSGIGPTDHLRSLGIEVVSDLPVGDNLQDHLFVPHTFPVSTGRVSKAGRFLLAAARERVVPDSTVLSQSLFEGMGFVRSPYAGDVPDLQLVALPYGYPSAGDARRVPPSAPALTVFSILIYPRSRGTVRLASTDPDAAPLIDPSYLAEPDDVNLLVSARELVEEVMSDPAIASDVTGGARRPRPSRTEAAREVRDEATSVYHPVGTCRIGVDDRAVVDPLLRVHGVESLRVADASVMPSITGGPTNAAAMMIGEHAAQLILGSEAGS